MWKRVLILLALVLSANVAALVTASRNVTDTPDAVVLLTERELQPLTFTADATGMTLRLRLADRADDDVAWFDRAKLQSVGFDCRTDPWSAPAEKRYRSMAFLPRAAWAVLVYQDGPAPAQTTQDTADASAGARPVRPPSSRLHAIDVGNDPAALRRQYPDRARFIVTRAIVHLTFVARSERGGPALRGRVTEPLPAELYVPREWQPEIAGRDSHFTATVEYGRDRLPRITRVTKRPGDR